MKQKNILSAMVLCAMLPMMTACGAKMYEENTVGIHTVQGDNKMYAEYAEGAVVDQESYATVKENTFRKSADYPLSTPHPMPMFAA